MKLSIFLTSINMQEIQEQIEDELSFEELVVLRSIAEARAEHELSQVQLFIPQTILYLLYCNLLVLLL